MELNLPAADSDATTPIKVRGMLVDDGKQILAIQTDPGATVTPASPPALTDPHTATILKMSLTDLLLGRPLATEEEQAERIGPLKGIPDLRLDALSSAAYGPEAALTMLLPLGAAGIAYIVPISLQSSILLASSTSPTGRPSQRIRTAAAPTRSRRRIWASGRACWPPRR